MGLMASQNQATSASHRGHVGALHGCDPPPRVWPEALAAVLSLEHVSTQHDLTQKRWPQNSTSQYNMMEQYRTRSNISPLPRKIKKLESHTYIRRLPDTVVRHQFVHINRSRYFNWALPRLNRDSRCSKSFSMRSSCSLFRSCFRVSSSSWTAMSQMHWNIKYDSL